ncbi:MAG: O-antigen ligase family protein [Myxococcaceae bacterium]|nr:O-antigen ligase family protein [Myxococcaceae bacterium]
MSPATLQLDVAVARPAATARPVPKTPRLNRALLLLTCLSVAAATMRELRLEVGGLLVPLNVLPVLVALPAIVLQTFNRFPRNVRVALLVFTGLFCLSVLRYGSSFGDLVKMLSSVLTIFAVALMMRRAEDFALGTVALCIALLVANLNGIRVGYVDYVGYKPLGDLANKNAYSLYALPIALVAGFTLLHFRTRLVTRAIVAAAIVSTTFVLFNGANRSGWGGMLLIAALLAVQTRRWRALFTVAGLTLISYGAFAWLGSSQTLDYRIQQTRDGYASDELRWNMLLKALEVASENPILGVTPQELGYEMARRLNAQLDRVDTHNFIAYIAAGSGFPALFALLAVALTLWRRPFPLIAENRAASDLLRMLCLLFVFRGLFSREIFFVGPFPIALGLSVGLLMVSTEEAQRRASAAQTAA